VKSSKINIFILAKFLFHISWDIHFNF